MQQKIFLTSKQIYKTNMYNTSLKTTTVAIIIDIWHFLLRKHKISKIPLAWIKNDFLKLD